MDIAFLYRYQQLKKNRGQKWLFFFSIFASIFAGRPQGLVVYPYIFALFLQRII